MRIFVLELKKLFNWKLLLALAVLCGLTYAAFMSSGVHSYNTMSGIFGNYQREMFEKYGDELTPKEYADYDVPGKIAEVTAELDAIIAAEPTFAKYGIYRYADYEAGMQAFDEKYFADLQPGPLPQPYGDDQGIMMAAIYQTFAVVGDSVIGIAARNTPTERLAQLKAVERYYSPNKESVQSFARLDMRPVVSEAAAEYFERTTFNLINYDLTLMFSLNAAIVAVFAVLASLVLIAPFITTDRARKMQYLQYSAKAGRKVFRTQTFAAAVAALLVGIVVIAATYALFFAKTDAADYLNSGAQLYSGMSFFIYNVTFGQYVAILAGMTLALCAAAACFAVVLGRYSSNIVGMMLKAVPVGAAASVLAALALLYSFNSNNFLTSGRIARITGGVPYAEAVICAGALLIGLAAAAVVVIREQRADAA
ncbi:MAG: hypothetical protein LBT12_00825 [Oscillospiraceae bacterium]|jgi:hypothetical protein|nr:hypothetical protein [Oscillospiraceae bacterium]